MDKIVESTLNDLIRRVEILEEAVRTELKPKPQVNTKVKKFFDNNLISEGQMKYIRILGGNPNENMTKAEAGKEIDRLLEIKKDREIARSVNEPPEVDTDEAGLDSEDLM